MSALRAKLYAQEETELLEGIYLSESERKRYNIANPIRAAIDDRSYTGIETEVSEMIAKRCGRAPRGIYVPLDLQVRAPLHQGTFSTGGAAVQTSVMPFVEVLRNKTVAMKAGATVLPDLKNNIALVKQTGDYSNGWTVEVPVTDITPDIPTFDQVVLSPKIGYGATQATRQWLGQTNDALVTEALFNGLAKSVGVALDRAAFFGSGASGQPKGLFNQAGIGTVDGTSIAWQGITTFEKNTLAANASEETFSYVAHPNTRDLLKNRARGTYLGFIVNEQNAIGPYPCHATAQIDDGKFVGGDFAQLVIGLWGGLDLVVDPFIFKKQGLVEFFGFMYVDVGVPFPSAFTVSTNVS
jgi:HK97 family phage major capsid protein